MENTEVLEKQAQILKKIDDLEKLMNTNKNRKNKNSTSINLIKNIEVV